MLYCYPAVCLQYTFPYLIPLLSCQVTLFFLILCNERVLFLLFLALSSYCFSYSADKSFTFPCFITLLFLLLCWKGALHLLFPALSRCCFCYSAHKSVTSLGVIKFLFLLLYQEGVLLLLFLALAHYCFCSLQGRGVTFTVLFLAVTHYCFCYSAVKNRVGQWGTHSFQKNATFLRSFPFIIK